MNDTKVLLERIAAFRQRLDRKPTTMGVKTDPTPSAEPVKAPATVAGPVSKASPATVAEPVSKAAPVLSAMTMTTASVAEAVKRQPEAFDAALRSIAGPGGVNEGPALPVLTSRAYKLLRDAHALIAWQRKFNSDPVYAGLASAAGEGATTEAQADTLVSYHRESVAMMDSAIRLVQSFPDSPSVQLKLCDGLEGVLDIVKQRHSVQERALQQRKTDLHRIDRLAAVYTALHQRRAVTLKPLAALAEELLEDARQSRPLRYVYAAPTSTLGYIGGLSFPAPARFAAARALNTALIVARIVGFDYEWASRPLLPVVAALIKDCGMMRIPTEILAKTEPLTAADRRLVEEHPRHGSDLVLVHLAESAPLAEAVATHHERLDGTGYPMGLKGEQLKPLARMLAVADTYASLSTDRPDRPAHDPRTALTDTLLLAEQGTLDKDFCEYLISLTFYPVGTIVELTDGRVGLVAANHPNRMDPRSSARPVIAVLAEADGTICSRPEHLDLSAVERGGIQRALPVEQRRTLLGQRYPDLV